MFEGDVFGGMTSGMAAPEVSNLPVYVYSESLSSEDSPVVQVSSSSK